MIGYDDKLWNHLIQSNTATFNWKIYNLLQNVGTMRLANKETKRKSGIHFMFHIS